MIGYIRKNVDRMSRKDIAHELGCSVAMVASLIKNNCIDFDENIVKMRKGFAFSKNSQKRRDWYAKRKGINGRM